MFYQDELWGDINDLSVFKTYTSASVDHWLLDKFKNLVLYFEDYEEQEYFYTMEWHEGVSLRVIGGKLFADEFKEYHNGYFERKGIFEEPTYVGIGEVEAISIIASIFDDHKLFTKFCEWCKEKGFDLKKDLIESGKKWKKLIK